MPAVDLGTQAETVRRSALATLDVDRQRALAQFFTPRPVAAFMAGMLRRRAVCLRILDPGAGTGALGAAAVAELLQRPDRPQRIELVAWELDADLHADLAATLAACTAAGVAQGVDVHTEIIAGDFIGDAVAGCEAALFQSELPRFDLAILNPPYGKLAGNSRERALLHRIGIDVGNRYAAFVALAYRLLLVGGEMVSITPRSFCNGPYFRAFRRDLIAHTRIDRLHVYDSRTEAFAEGEVLQETVIMRAVRRGLDDRADDHRIVISASGGSEADTFRQRELPASDIIAPADAEALIRLPIDLDDAEVTTVMAAYPGRLAGLGVCVSTGPVVDFRLRSELRAQATAGAVPLLWSFHCQQGCVRWPSEEARKPQAIHAQGAAAAWLVPSGTYVLVKRLTSKEERRRLVAAMLDGDALGHARLGIENHLNYLHADGRGLDSQLALGLTVWCNSAWLDRAFRQWSGHTQVNATDLRRLPCPRRDQVLRLAEMHRAGVDGVAIDAAIAAGLPV